MLFATGELKRSSARFALLTVGSGLLVFVLLFQQALLDSLLDGMAGAIDQQSAPVLVLARDAQQSVGSSVVTGQQHDLLAGVPGVGGASELGVTYLTFRSEGSDERHNASVIGFRTGGPGVPTGLRSGRLPEAPDEVVASAEDAPGRYGIGETITIEPGGTRLTVVGMTEGGRMGISPTVWTPWDTYRGLVSEAVPDSGQVLPSVLAVQPEPGHAPGEVVRSINAAAPALEAMTREAVAANAPGRDTVQLGFLLVMGLSYLVVAVVVGFFFLTLTLHKEQAITTLRALGFRGGYLVRCVLWQVLVVTAGGMLIGTAMLYAAVPLLRSTILLSVDPQGMALAAGPALAASLLAAVPSLRRVLRTDASTVFNRASLGGLG